MIKLSFPTSILPREINLKLKGSPRKLSEEAGARHDLTIKCQTKFYQRKVDK